MQKEEQYIQSLDYSDISRALSKDFFRIYCVNTDTEAFVEYIPHANDKTLDVSMMGKDFSEIMKQLHADIYSEDREMVFTAVTKENILKVLETDSNFLLDFRIMMEGKPVYVKLKVVRIRQDDPAYLLFALSNADAHMQRMAIYERAMSSQFTFSAISEALTSDYVCIIYVDVQTNEYIEYSSSEIYKTLGFSQDGADFFEMCRTEFVRIIFEEDRDIFLRALNKENLLKALSVDQIFLLTFRIVLDDAPVHMRVKITKMNQNDNHHLVVGLTNIEANIQRVRKYEQMKEIANRDSLTGVRSKHAFTDDEKRFNRTIEDGLVSSFAVVVCDVNGLKKINDTLGHQAGDEYLRRSCKMICVVFSHSPVYRIGGDEFAVILTGSDYENRNVLMKELHNLSAAHIGTNEAIVSGGMSEYDPEQDHCLQDAFERADALMYEEKMMLKNLGAVTRDDETEQTEMTEDFPIIHLRKHILIADDQETNREILGTLLENDYDILYAGDGVETMEMLRKHKDEIALLLLDLYMPNMSGRDVLRKMQVDEELMSIPVIMLTVDPKAELDSLKLGAVDFISKPYPDIAIVSARINKAIELSENRDLIRNTQRDKLTGLLNYEYFIQYAERLNQQYKESTFDAFVCDIKDFHSVNETYGRQFGDLVLRSIGINFRKMARKTSGIGCRKGGDTFLLYCPHRTDYDQLIRNFREDLFVEKETADKVSLKFAVFENADREPDIEKRFTCVKEAADSVKDYSEILYR